MFVLEVGYTDVGSFAGRFKEIIITIPVIGDVIVGSVAASGITNLRKGITRFF